MRGGGGGSRGVFKGVVGVLLLLFVPFLSGGGAGTAGVASTSELPGAGLTSSAENLCSVASTVSCHLMWIPSPAHPATDSARTLGKPW